MESMCLKQALEKIQDAIKSEGEDAPCYMSFWTPGDIDEQVAAIYEDDRSMNEFELSIDQKSIIIQKMHDEWLSDEFRFVESEIRFYGDPVKE